MQRILVTGGSGFLGSHLVEELLARGYAVTVVDDCSDAPRSNLAAALPHCELIEADVRDDGFHARVGPLDAIVHLAANANVPRSSKEPVFDASINILGTINALNLARDRGARFFLASSGAVYGEPVTVPMAETHLLEPASPYGASKLSAEHYVALYRRLYGVPGTVFRFFNMYGPRQRRFVVYDFAWKILNAGPEVVILGDGRQVRSQLYVTDAVRAALTVMERGTEPVYNIGSAASLSVTELMHKMLRLFAAEKTLTTSQTSWDGDIHRLVPDVTKLHALGYREEVSHEDGLQRFKDWFLAEYRIGAGR